MSERDAHADWTPPHAISVRGLFGTAVFSPNGKRIAFENPRGGYSTQEPNPWGPSRSYTWGYIAIYDFADGRLRYVDPSFARDSDPHWLDDRTIAYTRRRESFPDELVSREVDTPPAAASAHRQFLESLLGAALLYQPTPSGDGESLAFVAREGRTSSVYFAHRSQAAQALIRYTDDDGQQLSEVAVSAEGRWVAYVRGGVFNAKGEVPNPRSEAVPPLRQIYVVDTTRGSAPRAVGTGSEPQFTPDGRALLWLAARGIAMATLPAPDAADEAWGAVQYVLSGPAKTLRLSPDGSRMAYQRSQCVEIYDFANHQTWAVPKPAEATDFDPAWSTDGLRIAFRREVGHQPDTETGSLEPFIAKQPWAIWVADLTAHQARAVWHAEPGTGSAYFELDQDATDAGSRGDQLFWSSDNHIAFAWEHDGWRHLYAVSAEGGAARLLTPGNGEVESASVALDHKHLIFSTNLGDPERRHIAMASFDGAPPVPLTGGTMSQWAPVGAAAGSLAYIEAGWAKPAAVIWQDAAQGTRTAGPNLPSSFPSSKLVEPKAVSFHGTDGHTAYGQLFVPGEANGCGLIFVHGGIKRQMLLGFHYMDVYSNLYELNQYLVSRGCTVLSVEYRSSIMRGYGFRNASRWGTAGASEYKDVLGGANYLKSRADLRITHLGIYGLSWGGYLTAQALARNSDVFEVGFDMAGVHAFRGQAFKHSPAAFAGRWRSPVYIAAGDDDRNVDFNQSIFLVQALRSNPQKIEIAEKVFPNETHPMNLTLEHLTDLYWDGSEFMLQHLLQGEQPSG